MRFKTWPVAAVGLGGLVALIVVSMLASSRKADEIYVQLNLLNTYHHNVDARIRRLRSDIHLSGILIRDYLLDAERQHASEYLERLTESRRASKATLAELRSVAARHDDRVRSLEAQLDDYWKAYEPLFNWTPRQIAASGADFLKSEVVPRREAVMALAYEIEGLNEANLAEERSEVARQYAAFREDLQRLLWRSVALGLVVAIVAVFRLRLLEQRSDRERAVVEEAERQTRLLSQRLVAAQEEERKNLSRELHDHVAQVLTALRMEICRIDRARGPGDTRLAAAAAECLRLVDGMFRTVRDLALGLRPSMLDDFGLQPALEWHVRDVANRFDVRVDLTMDGDFGALPDQHRTCVYRAVQEALTNCVRHAQARSVSVHVTNTSDALDVSVSDDGIGLDPAQRQDGLGLRGIEERVKELHGTMTIDGRIGRGTTLRLRLPLAAPSEEVPRARIAG